MTPVTLPRDFDSTYAPAGVVRRVRNIVARDRYCYIADANDRVRVVDARVRKGVLEFRALNTGEWFSPTPSWVGEETL